MMRTLNQFEINSVSAGWLKTAVSVVAGYLLTEEGRDTVRDGWDRHLDWARERADRLRDHPKNR